MAPSIEPSVTSSCLKTNQTVIIRLSLSLMCDVIWAQRFIFILPIKQYLPFYCSSIFLIFIYQDEDHLFGIYKHTQMSNTLTEI
jgi:hypothetical protein